MAHRIRRALGLLLVLSGLVFIAAPASSALGAKFDIAPGGFTVEMLDAEGNPEHAAGSHPDRLRINFALEIEETTARDLEFELPPGLSGNPAAVPLCGRNVYESKEKCPPESQVGVVETFLSGGAKVKLPLFELEPRPGQTISFGSEPSLELPLTSELRPGDFGVTFKANDLPQEPIAGGTFELWGIPADRQEGTGIPRRALLTAPSTCGPLVFEFRTRSWQEGAPWLSASADTGEPLTGCEELDFDPKLGLQLSNPIADSPTGMRMDLSVPEEEEESERADAEMENVTVEMPKGVGISPAGVEGLVACTDSQFGLGESTEAQCPPSAKLGVAEFSSPALGAPLSGTIYLGEERPGRRLRVFVVTRGSGALFKSVGTLGVNAATGRLSTALEGLPQVPIQRVSLVFEGGPGALLASPLACGPAIAYARFEPYGGGTAVESTASAAIQSRPGGGACTGPGPFTPELATESSARRAGRPTTISTMLQRRPGEQLPRKFTATFPAGMSARLGAVQLCAATEVAARACAASSKIGDVLAKVGSGSNPVALHGSAYLTDSYHRAPLGLLIELRAKIGPFDLGTTTMQGAAELDPRSGRLTVSMDSLPEEIEGIPVRFQAIELKMNRPGFIRNPTSCSARSAAVTLESQSGALASAASRFRFFGCGRLGFEPGVQMEFLNRGELHKHARPGLRVTVRARRGDTNLRGMRLSMPSALRFAVAGLKEICSRQDALEGACPSGSRIGSARARTSTLSRPLSGSVYIAQPRGNGPPDVWVSLVALGVRMNLRGATESTAGHFVTTLSGMPDMPLSALTMRLGDGDSHIFSLGVSPCLGGHARQFVSTVGLEGQNGARRTLHPRIKAHARCSGSPRPHSDVPRRAPGPAGSE
jgi:hypothetical protein